MTPDPMDPNNWMPFYHAESGRRAIPVAVAGLLDKRFVYMTGLIDEPDSWAFVESVHPIRGPGFHIQAEGEGLRRYTWNVEADFPLYLEEADVRRCLPTILPGLRLAFDALWERTRLGALKRSDFDARAEHLRSWRASLQSLAAREDRADLDF